KGVSKTFGGGRRLGRSDVSGSEPVSPQVPHVVKRINQGLQRAEIHGVRCPPPADVAGKVCPSKKSMQTSEKEGSGPRTLRFSDRVVRVLTACRGFPRV